MHKSCLLACSLLGILILIRSSGFAQAAGGQPPAQAQEERDRRFANPPELLSPPGLQEPTAALLRAEPAPAAEETLLPCRGDTPVVHGSQVSTTLHIAYSDHQIYNPNTATYDTAHLRTYNDCLVGPTVRVIPGDTLRMTLRNELPLDNPAVCPKQPPSLENLPNCFNAGNLHTHGLHVSPAGNSDNVLISIDPQTNFTYQYAIPPEHPSGTFWYHSHRHGSTAVSVTSGMEGVLVVQGHRKLQDKAADGIADIDTILHTRTGAALPERIMIFQQIAYACFTDANFTTISQDASGAWTCPAATPGVVENFLLQFGFPNGKDVWPTSQRHTTINGKMEPIITTQAGRIERWRMVHGGVRDTINLQIVKAVTVPNAPAALPTLNPTAAGPVFATREARQQFITQACTGTAVPQFEFALDGLTRPAFVTKDIDPNILQPGYRSDALVVFPSPGLYCVLDQEGGGTATVIAPDRRPQGKDRQLLAIVEVRGTAVSGDLSQYVRTALVQANQDLPAPVLADLGQGRIPEFVPHADIQPAPHTNEPTAIFNFALISAPPSPAPTQPAILGKVDNAGIPTNGPVPYDVTKFYQATLGGTDDWTLGSGLATHVFHIHVNPFQIISILDPSGKPIIDPATGKCTERALTPPDPQYCDLIGSFRDTVFVKQNYQIAVRTKYEDYIGEYVLHCHILDHEDQGMMMNVNIVPGTTETASGGH